MSLLIFLVFNLSGLQLSYELWFCAVFCVCQVHYELNASTGKLNFLHGIEHFMSNLSKLLQWSPYSTEAELLKQVSC